MLKLLAYVKKESLNIKAANPYMFLLAGVSTGISSILLTYFVTRLFGAVGRINFKFVVIGVISYNALLSIMMPIGRSLLTEKRRRTMDGLILANVNFEKMFLGVMIANLPFVLVEVAILTIFSMFLGVDFSVKLDFKFICRREVFIR